MPSVSPAQKHLMAAVAHGWHKPGGGGPSVAVAKEFNQADKTMSNKGYQGSTQKFAEGGPVLGKTSSFMKTPDQFRDDKSNATDETWGKGSGGGGDGGPAAPAQRMSKSLSPVKPRK